MDLAQQLVRSCVRAFHDTKHILVVDALILHSALRDDDLAYLMGINTKELHKLCGKLMEERFLAVHTRQEIKEGQQRPMNRTYYYIDYRATIDAIKWRVYLIDKQVQGNTVPQSEIKEYRCNRCKSEWTALELMHKFSNEGLLCDKCEYVVVPIVGEERGGHEQSTRLNAQFKFITDLLPKIDSVPVPESTFEKALESARKVNRDVTNPASETAPLDAATERPTAVKGMVNVAPASLLVTLTKSEGPTDADIAAEKDRKQKNAAQNALPVHFTHSTISGEQVKFDQNSTLPTSHSVDDKKNVATDEATTNGQNAEIDDYFARLKAEQDEEAAKDQNDEYETDDEDDEEEEFEDVVPPASNTATPASSLNVEGKVSGSGTQPHIASAMKRKWSSASGSGSSTRLTSPATGPNTPSNEDSRPPKKVRIEEPVAPKDEAESEEDMEFEDV
ncbi:hypothetical protein HYALB_00008716 [Hymenoscyphus albidus]|uniref:HTH TFE/IIEalpha-type domain-containing protein n=1 Tax=Hymenoscyphus albidus TaxID=595503 RepID=A0A9N9Q2S3_9HELO|nr:hypothetical protein HYALB_00008716 [Hymenoscyphus albidus]